MTDLFENEGKYISFVAEYDWEDADILTEVIEKNGFVCKDMGDEANYDYKGRLDVELCVAMGDDMPHGIIVYNDEVLNSKDIMDVLKRMEGYDECYDTETDDCIKHLFN